MINLFRLSEGRLLQISIDLPSSISEVVRNQNLIDNVIWVDLTDPTGIDYFWIEQHFQLDLPTEDDIKNLEASSRFYKSDDGSIHLRSDFLIDDINSTHSVPTAFILVKNILFSLHFGDSPIFRLVRMRGRTLPGSISDYRDILLDIYSTDAEYSADALEDIYLALERASNMVLQGKDNSISDTNAREILTKIAHEENTNGYIRRNMMDTRRALSFLMRGKILNTEQQEEARQILRDIESLYGHTAFLFDKINFLMDAVVGFINVNQNRVVKILSLVNVALLPPTLIASIYGMNFRRIPELDWELGYPFSLAVMLLSVAVPLIVFYKRGWLR